MEIRTYQSSMSPDLALTAEFYVPDTPKPLCLFFHGWHMNAAGSAKGGHLAELEPHFFAVNVDMRGRGGSSGTPDASGHELLDALDALDFARETWPDAVAPGSGVYAVGGSGGGGNTLAIAGKAPDVFAAAAAWAGMSDYALWFNWDERRRYRDEAQDKGWIGGTPETNPEGYHARGGLNVIENVITNLLVIHGAADQAVPVEHAERYRDRAETLGRKNIRVLLNDKGHASQEWPLMIEHLLAHPTAPVLPAKGTLLVHSFLACRSFRLVLDDPARMGAAEYELDDAGRLRSLCFTQQPGLARAEEFLLRIAGPVRSVTVQAPGETFAPEQVSAGVDHDNFRFRAPTPWTATVA